MGDKAELFKAINFNLHKDIEEVVAKVSLKQKDKDGDGFLSTKELFELSDDDMSKDETWPAEEFAKIDTNGDGKIDSAELAPFESGRHHTEISMKALVDALDTDGDGHASTEELLNGHAKALEDGVDGLFHLEQWVHQH